MRRGVFSLFALALVLSGGDSIGADLVEVRATLVPVKDAGLQWRSQEELRALAAKEAQTGGVPLLRYSSVVESGKWAKLKKGREFHFPVEYRDAILAQSKSDAGEYSIPGVVSEAATETCIIPQSPVTTEARNSGGVLKVKPVLKNDGTIHLSGSFSYTVLEGFAEKGDPIKVTHKGVGNQKKVIELLPNFSHEPIFLSDEYEIQTTLQPGGAENPDSFCVPVRLGSPLSDSRLNELLDTELIHATQLKKIEGSDAPAFGILQIESKRLKVPGPNKINQPGEKFIYLTSRYVESVIDPKLTKSVLSDSEFQMEVRRLVQRKGVDVLSAPSAITNSGQSAKVEVVREFIFPTRYDPPMLSEVKKEGSFPISPSVPVDFKTVMPGVTLEVEPTLAGKGNIRLEMKSKVLEFARHINFGNEAVFVQRVGLKKAAPIVVTENKFLSPVFSFRESETDVTIPNGSTVVFSTTLDYSEVKIEEKGLFGLGKATVTTERLPRYLTVFVTAKLVDSAGIE